MGQVKCLHEDCKYSAQQVGQLQTHIKTSHSSSNIKTDLYPCPHCEQKATRTYSIKCPHCDKRYKHKSHIKEHINVVHEGKGKLLPCSFCDYKATRKQALQNHIKTIHQGVSVRSFKYSIPMPKM